MFKGTAGLRNSRAHSNRLLNDDSRAHGDLALVSRTPNHPNSFDLECACRRTNQCRLRIEFRFHLVPRLLCLFH